jgi:hypothetical protein
MWKILFKYFSIIDTRTNLIWRKVIQPQRPMLKKKLKKQKEKELYGVKISCTQSQSIWVISPFQSLITTSFSDPNRANNHAPHTSKRSQKKNHHFVLNLIN